VTWAFTHGQDTYSPANSECRGRAMAHNCPSTAVAKRNSHDTHNNTIQHVSRQGRLWRCVGVAKAMIRRWDIEIEGGAAPQRCGLHAPVERLRARQRQHARAAEVSVTLNSNLRIRNFLPVKKKKKKKTRCSNLVFAIILDIIVIS
jgi:hypothetical protein